MEHPLYYRPVWTVGKYNQRKHVAIMYNLIEGQSHFFEDVSADVIGKFLLAKRGEQFSPADLLENMNLPSVEIENFLSTLQSLGLLLPGAPSDFDESAYRMQVKEARKNVLASIPSMKEPIETNDSAERAYFDAIASPTTVVGVMFELTYNCSERCLHCYNPGATRNETEKNGRGNREELNLDDYKRIIDELCDLGLVKVCLSGGDPFSKDIAWEIIDYLYQREIATDIFTNGLSIIGKEEQLAKYYPRIVGISLHSGIPKDHERLTRVQGSWAKTYHVLNKLGNLAVPLNLKCCITRINVKSYFTVKEIAQQVGALPQFELNITDGVDGDKCASRHLRLTQEEMEIVLMDDYIAKTSNLYDPISIDKVLSNLGDKICGAGHDSFCITPEGNLQPCCAFPLVLGNLKEQSVRSILSGNEKLRKWRTIRPTELQECYTHDYCLYCRICPGNNQVANGDPLIPSENNCTVAKIKRDFCKKRISGYDPLCGKTIEERLKGLPDYKISLHREIAE